MTVQAYNTHMDKRHLAPADTSGQWLSVADAVAYCARHGLNRNIKTIRRWAERSLKRPDEAEVKVREQDTGFGFRYMIEQSSLDLKIRQELDFEAKQAKADTSGHDHASPDMPSDAHDETKPSVPEEMHADTPGHDQAVPDEPARKLAVHSIGDDFLKSQMKEKDGQIAELNKQLERKDDQIMTMLERDRETNILIRGLQNTVADILQLKPPTRYRDGGDDQIDDADPSDMERGRTENVDNVDQPDDRLGV